MGPNVKRFNYYIWRIWEHFLCMFSILSFDTGLFRLGFLLFFSRVAVLFSTRCSRVGIPPLSFEEPHWEIFYSSFHIIFLVQDLANFFSVVFARDCAVLLGVAVEGIGISVSELVAHWRKVSFT